MLPPPNSITPAKAGAQAEMGPGLRHGSSPWAEPTGRTKEGDAASNHPKALEHKRHPLRFREISVTNNRDGSRLLQIGDTFFIVID